MVYIDNGVIQSIVWQHQFHAAMQTMRPHSKKFRVLCVCLTHNDCDWLRTSAVIKVTFRRIKFCHLRNNVFLVLRRTGHVYKHIAPYIKSQQIKWFLTANWKYWKDDGLVVMDWLVHLNFNARILSTQFQVCYRVESTWHYYRMLLRESYMILCLGSSDASAIAATWTSHLQNYMIFLIQIICFEPSVNRITSIKIKLSTRGSRLICTWALLFPFPMEPFSDCGNKINNY